MAGASAMGKTQVRHDAAHTLIAVFVAPHAGASTPPTLLTASWNVALSALRISHLTAGMPSCNADDGAAR